ncbi:LOW QUALITY PROTEIN: hypothetical protein AAY473_037202 [Plecturocebus cupreus]
MASSIKSSSSSGLQCNCVVPAYIGNKDLETLTLQALQHNLMASSFTQSTTQSTVAQQSSQEATVLQARRPEAELARPSSSWGCCKAARRCISVLMRGPNKPSCITTCPPPSRSPSAVKPCLSKPSRITTWPSPSRAPPAGMEIWKFCLTLWHNCVASLIKTSTAVVAIKPLPQQPSPNHVASPKQLHQQCWGFETLAHKPSVPNSAPILAIKTYETLTLQALQHDLMASFLFPEHRVQHSSQESTVLQARQPEAVLTWTTRSWGCCRAEMQFNTNERPQQAVRHNRGASSMGISISSGGDLETLPQQALPHHRVASSIKSSTSSGGDLETLAQQALQCNCVVAAYIGSKYLETLTQQALQLDLMASFFTQSTESTVLQARQPDAVLAPPSKSWGCRKAARRCISILIRGCNKPSGITTSVGDLETLPQQALLYGVASLHQELQQQLCGDLQTLAQQGLQCNCVVPAYIGNEDLETLTLQALQHDLMASSLTERTIQSTVAQQSSQEATVLQARQPEAVLAWPSSSWGCRKAAIRYISILMRGPNKTSAITTSGGDLETLAQQALPHNHVASSIKSSTSSGEDLETLAQQALQCNCVVTAYIGNKDLETLILQALHHDLMASSFTQRNTQSTVAQQSSQEATVLQGCQEVHFNTNERPQPALQHNRVSSSVVISISSHGDLETLPQEALPHNHVASSIQSSTSSDLHQLWWRFDTLPQQALPHNLVASTIKSSTRSAGDLETLAQQALPCNCVDAACIGNKDLETLTLQALQHDLMASSFTQSTTQSTVAQESSQEATVLQARQPEAVLAWPTRSWGCAGLPGDAFQY